MWFGKAATKTSRKALTRALGRLSRNPGLWPKSYKLLLDAEVYVLESGERKDTPDNPGYEMIHLEMISAEDGNVLIPFFHTLEVLQACIADAGREEALYASVNARTLFETYEGNFVLDPGTIYEKVFMADEVKRMLALPR